MDINDSHYYGKSINCLPADLINTIFEVNPVDLKKSNDQIIIDALKKQVKQRQKRYEKDISSIEIEVKVLRELLDETYAELDKLAEKNKKLEVENDGLVTYNLNQASKKLKNI
jgi:hypothetical protein